MGGARLVHVLPADLLVCTLANSPHLNIAEILWRKLKYEWLQPAHYADKEMLHDAVKRLLNEVGATLKIAFKPFHTV